MTGLARYEEDIASFRRVVLQALPEKRPAAFFLVCREAVRLVEVAGVPKPDVMDAMREIGVEGELAEEAIQAGLADAVVHPFEPPATPSAAKPPPAGPLLVTSAQFVKGFIPPDYLIDGILQRGFIYSFTGQTGAGKTAVALWISYCVGEGRPIGDYEVAQGRVLYCAGENPDDIRMRWIAMSETVGFAPNIPVHFIDRPIKISTAEAEIRREVETLGGLSLVVVDTSAAFFEGTDENDNVAMGKHARMLRNLTTLPGRPVVLVPCHPTKNAGADNLLPRGGGAFLNEMDGNLTGSKKDELVEAHWQGKFRGPDFERLSFRLTTIKPAGLVDSRGRSIPSVIAKPIGEAEQAELENSARRDEDVLLILMRDNEGASIAELAKAAKWVSTKDGKPQKSKVHRLLKTFQTSKLAGLSRNVWTLTNKGTAEANNLAETAA